VLAYSSSLHLAGEVALTSPPVHLHTEPRGNLLATLIGTFPPNHRREGAVVRIQWPDGAGTPAVELLADDLPRPVATLSGDFDRDGIGDLLVAGFGYAAGELALFRGRPGGGFARHVILAEPGAIALAPGALWGAPDSALALFGQGRERVTLVGGLGDAGPPHETALATFPPSQGSSSMRTVDFDRDGDLDLLYTAGDNADYSPVLKPYHGVYLLENTEGPNTTPAFRQASSHTLPSIAQSGRFIALDTGDLDGDDDIDIALANFAYGPPTSTPTPTLDAWLRSSRVTLRRNLHGD
jgi:hypothetical protein